MKVIIYTASSCPFSREEKEYLQSRNIAFEEKNVEENRDYLAELLTVSHNFAGTPVTRIEKDDGQVVVLKGFTRQEFEDVLAPAASPVEPELATLTTPTPTPPPATTPAPTDAPPTPPQVEEPQPEPAAPPPPEPQPPTPHEEPLVPAVSEPSPQEVPQKTESSDALDAILKDLQNKVNETYSSSTKQNQPDTPSPKPIDQPHKPPPPPLPQPEEPPAPQPSVPTPSSNVVVPDFPK